MARFQRIAVLWLFLVVGVGGRGIAAQLDPELAAAFATLTSYTEGADRAPLQAIERAAKRGRPALRAQLEAALIAVLRDSSVTVDGKHFAAMLLFRIGTKDAVPALVALLTEPKLAPAIAGGLAYLPYPEVDQALLSALSAVEGKERIITIEALGRRRSREAVPAMAALMGAASKEEAAATIAALGRIGGAEATEALAAADVPEGLEDAWARALRECAGRARLGSILKVASGSQRAVLLRVIGAEKDAETLALVLPIAKDPDPGVQLAVAEILARWRDPSPATAVLEMAQNATDDQVRMVALRGYLRLMALTESPSPAARERAASIAMTAARTDAEKAMIRASLKELQVYVVEVASGKPCEVVEGGLKRGAKVYIDRQYTFARIPARFRDATFVRMAMEDKYNGSDRYMVLSLSKPATLFVAFDNRATSLPTWLRDWTETGDSLRSTDKGCRPKIYSKSVGMGKVVLGGNKAPGAGAHYVVIVAD